MGIKEDSPEKVLDCNLKGPLRDRVGGQMKAVGRTKETKTYERR